MHLLLPKTEKKGNWDHLLLKSPCFAPCPSAHCLSMLWRACSQFALEFVLTQGLILLVWGWRARTNVPDCWARLHFHRLYGARSICRQILAGTAIGSLSAFSPHDGPVSHTRPCHT